MFPTLNNTSFVSQPADGLSGNDLINYYLTHGDKEKVIEILRTKCLAERQLTTIQSRGQLNLSNQYCIWISQRITIIRQHRLD